MYTTLTQSDLAAPVVIDTPGTHVFWLSAVSGTLDLHVQHSGAIVYIYGVYDLSSDDKHALSVVQHHTAPGAESHVLVKGVLRDQSRFRFDGVIRIDADGTETNATLVNRNLVLSGGAFVQSHPQLEVVPADVRCSHATTVSTVNPEQLHYLMSRGLSEGDARDAIVDGFLEDVVRQRDAHDDK